MPAEKQIPIANMHALWKKKLFLLDMDGTIYLGNRLFEGVCEFLELIRAGGGRYIFLTNNSSKSVDRYMEKLAGMGIPACQEDFLTSVHATALYLKRKGYSRIYAFGTGSFRQQLAVAGLPVTDRVEDGIDCLCLGFDTELTFQKLEDACILLGRNVDYAATNPDWVCPTEYGFVPDCGSVTQMLHHATGRMPVVIGKPQPAMVELAMEQAGFGPEETVVMGDRLYTDIALGKAGIKTVLVLSGETKREDLKESPFHPDVICKDLGELTCELKQ